jgi:D-arginine dehydrogenase
LKYDVVVIGGGIAGAAAAANIAVSKSVVVIERESQPGYHATGRSAALFSETYGNDVVRKLSVAGRHFLARPPTGFSDSPILTPRGAMHVGKADDRDRLDRMYEVAHGLVPSVRRLSSAEVRDRVPVLRDEFSAGGVFEPDAMDIDTNALLQGYLRQMRRSGGQVKLDAEVLGMARGGAGWILETRAGRIEAELVVNAAGAWADEVARMAGACPVGLVPKRRTAFIFSPSGVDVGGWPLVIGAREDFYFKPDAGNLLVSPADETPSQPMDAQPEELDLAIAADRLMSATSFDVRHILRSWAGLRTFAADKTPVSGFDPDVEGFIWHAGQGGYGFQTAPAMASYTAALATGKPLPANLLDLGLTAETLSPARFLMGNQEGFSGGKTAAGG